MLLTNTAPRIQYTWMQDFAAANVPTIVMAGFMGVSSGMFSETRDLDADDFGRMIAVFCPAYRTSLFYLPGETELLGP